MSGYIGREVKVRFDDHETVGSLTPLAEIAGGQSKTVTRGKTEVDVTSDDSDGWRELLVKPGMRNVDLAYNGVAKSEAFGQLMDKWEAERHMFVVIQHPEPESVWEGGWAFVQNLEVTGEHSGAVTFSATLLFTGALHRTFGTGFIGSRGANQLFTLDLHTGAGTAVSADDFNATHSSLDELQGLAFKDDTLYATLDQRLCTVNLANGHATRVSGAPQNFGTGVNESQPEALAVDPAADNAYVVGTRDFLIRVPLSTGVGIRVGSQNQYSANENNMNALCFHDDVLVGWGAQRDRAYTINKTTGAATQISASANTRNRSVDAGGFGSSDPISMASDGVNLFVATASRHLFRVDFNTWEAVRINRNGGYGITGVNNFNYLAIKN